MTITDWTAILGVIFGIAGLGVSLLNYRNDKSKIVVSLQWDAELKRVSPTELKPAYAYIYITNIGRRPAYITFVGIEYPEENQTIGLLTDGLNPIGQKLSEGDAPIKIRVPQFPDLEKYSQNWMKIRAYANDSLGKTYWSKKSDKPSWVKE